MNAAVIVETRDIDIDKAIDRHLQYLPGWVSIHYGKDDFNINSLYDYNRVLTSIEFWANLIDYKRVLIFQHDSGLLRDGIEDFMQWDYIGAPWTFQYKGGNGGLSLRNPRAMLKTINTLAYLPRYGHEDVYFSNHLEGILAPRNECFNFSCETIFQLGTLGYHFGSDTDRFLTSEQKQLILNQYEVGS